MTRKIILLQMALSGAYKMLAALFELSTGERAPKMRDLMRARE